MTWIIYLNLFAYSGKNNSIFFNFSKASIRAAFGNINISSSLCVAVVVLSVLHEFFLSGF
jgi:hypothetical protein